MKPIIDTESQDTPTMRVYRGLNDAFDMMNIKLFEGELPPVILTLQRKKNAYGFFCAQVFGGSLQADADKKLDEISLNPMFLNMREAADSLSTILHEMVHEWQEHYGTITPTNHHNREWAEKMKAVGLQPDNGKGGETGMACSHHIIPGGPFDLIASEVLKVAEVDAWGDVGAIGEGEDKRKKPKSGKYSKYKCTSCGAIARGKANMDLRCSDHGKMVEEKPKEAPKVEAEA